MVNWYSLFSHTGGETEAIWKRLVRVPTAQQKLNLKRALTTNLKYDGALLGTLKMSGNFIHQWLMTPDNVEPNSIITLNGYMRVLPKDVIDYLHSIGCKIYNIHPAPIQLYPELKGKDPQERLYEGLRTLKYTCYGCVIHEVDEGVDTGRIVHWVYKLFNCIPTKDELYAELHDMGTQMWFEFFEQEMYKDE